MSYLNDFEHSFMSRTLQILKEYEGERDATLLINCLLDLLIVPKERFLKPIPEDSLATITDWGIDGSSIKNHGRVTENNPNPATIRGFVINLRHSVAHFCLEPRSKGDKVHSFVFTNDSEFHADLPIYDIRNFVQNLARKLEDA